ncbi:hypothetical protein [Bradyrhizobium sp. 62]|uniref:hypothetical protein n=1 Tax=Bradyrhizobium sp. 62 TaxID=1043588 RepID=UPI001FF93661|nr:hypothetical protein [Bradyrhizobium sp. 62]MCK1368293.1 hypothetical protein [Bradyrhizobium sp. 62]
MPMSEVLAYMREGLSPSTRQILAMLDFYARKDHELPSADAPLTPEEEDELTPIVSALTIAAVQSEQTRDSTLAATLERVRRRPSIFDQGELPASVQWELAGQLQRKDEAPGTYAMDIWGTSQTRAPYVFGPPTEENLSAAAERALRQVQARRAVGRSPHPAHRELAGRLALIFAGSGRPIARRRKEFVRRERRGVFLRSREGGPFHEFLALTLPPLQRFLQERNLAPVTSDSLVRFAQGARKTSNEA